MVNRNKKEVVAKPTAAAEAIFRFVVVAFLVLVVAFVGVVNYAASESIYECSGVTKTTGTTKSEQTTLFIKLTHYRWWVLWGDSDGMLRYEILNTRNGLFVKLKRIGDYFNIYDDMKNFKGQLSTISDALTLHLTDETIFYGTCRPKK